MSGSKGRAREVGAGCGKSPYLLFLSPSPLMQGLRQMKRAIAALILLLWVGGLPAADAPELKVVGPSTAVVNADVRLRLDGLPAVDLTKVMNEQLNWLSEVAILVNPPIGVTPADYSLDQSLSVKVAPFRWSFDLDFKARKAGDYVVIIDWNKPPYGLCHHRIQVGGGGPGPVIDNPDPPPPPPSEVVGAVILMDREDIPFELAKVLGAIRNSEFGKKVEILDVEQTDEQDQPLKQVADLLKHFNGKPLPRIAGVRSDGSFSGDEELRADKEAMFAILRSWGLGA